MKKQLLPKLVFIVLFILPHFVLAQNDSYWHLNFGSGLTKFSYDYNGIDGIGFVPYLDYGRSIYFGSGFSQKIYKPISIDASLNLSYIVIKDSESEQIGTFRLNDRHHHNATYIIAEKTKVNYLSLPVVVKLRMNKFEFFYGARADFLIYSNHSIREYILTVIESEHDVKTESYEANFRKIDYGIMQGISYNICDALKLKFKHYKGRLNTLPKIDRDESFNRRTKLFLLELELKI